MSVDTDAIQQTLANARRRLLAATGPAGHWEGALSSSALSTATASAALILVDRAQRRGQFSDLSRAGLAWLVQHQNGDGGWGDTIESPSNISTTALCWAALGLSEQADGVHADAIRKTEDWLVRHTGSLAADNLAQSVIKAYGKDTTFSAPILTMWALAGRLGTGRDAWKHVPALPFELAAFPRGWFHRLGLGVVSYALPALIAVGHARHHHRPTHNPITRSLRALTRRSTLRMLRAIQPDSGGFLEATPLTSFVVMCLASIGRADHPVAELGTSFITGSARSDGSWPIDSNLATWVTTLSINSLATGHDSSAPLTPGALSAWTTWLLGQQHRSRHPYTGAAPGGWSWTDLSGGVPDADDTAGALLALRHVHTADETLMARSSMIDEAVTPGIGWLLDLQNKDGGMPTFCRGWGKLPFDRSSPDLTAHALRAWHAWRGPLAPGLAERVRQATSHAAQYLIGSQRGDGAWHPLWFGNQETPDQANPLYGTSRVLLVPDDIGLTEVEAESWLRAKRRGARWMLSSQSPDGGWGGGTNVAPSIEETGLAVEALAGLTPTRDAPVADAVARGCRWLVEQTQGGTEFRPAPIGLYFARLWYHEQLYPLIFTVAALNAATRMTSRS